MWEYIGLWVPRVAIAYLSSFCVMALLSALAIDAWRSPRPYLRRLSAVAFLALACFGGYGVAVGQTHQQAFRNAHSFWAYERGLPQPSLLAFESDAKTILQDAAKAEPGSQARQQALEQATRVAEEGIRYIDRYPGSRHRATSAEIGRIRQSCIWYSPGRRLGRNPHRAAAGLYQAAYQMMPNQYTALMLAQALLDWQSVNPRASSGPANPCATSTSTSLCQQRSTAPVRPARSSAPVHRRFSRVGG